MEIRLNEGWRELEVTCDPILLLLCTRAHRKRVRHQSLALGVTVVKVERVI